jgi:dipeptidase E
MPGIDSVRSALRDCPVSLALYSDQIIPANGRLDRLLLDMMARQGRGKRFGYIPSGPEPDRRFFRERQAYYDRCGAKLDTFFDMEAAATATELGHLLRCDAIHLSGGKTADFLRRMKKSGVIEVLREWALGGGVLVGASAGAILTTPTIATDALFSGADPVDSKDDAALGLAPFEFFPHLDADPAFLPALIRYSRRTIRPIIACRDGEGVLVDRDRVEFVGGPLWISDGIATPIEERADG